MAFDAPLKSNDQSFDRVLKAGLPVVAFVSAGTPDAALDQALKALAKAEAGKLLVATVRADENPQVAQRFAVRTPTLIAFQDGNEASRAEVPNPADVRAHAEYALGRGPKPVAAPPPAQVASSSSAAHPFPVTDGSFNSEVLNSKTPVMVDFWAPWCGPCRLIAPVLEKLAGEYAGRIRIAKLNVDENPRMASQYQVQSIPTLMLVKNGKIVDRIVGALPEPQLRKQVERLLA